MFHSDPYCQMLFYAFGFYVGFGLVISSAFYPYLILDVVLMFFGSATILKQFFVFINIVYLGSSSTYACQVILLRHPTNDLYS